MGNHHCSFYPGKEELVFQTEEEKEAERVYEVRKMQFSSDLPLAEFYAAIEKMEFGTCIMEADRETRGEFEMIMYLGDENLKIDDSHRAWELFDWLAVQYFNTFDSPMHHMTAAARTLADFRVKCFQKDEIDANSTKDLFAYDYLFQNWDNDVTIDICFLHKMIGEKTHRTIETRVLEWMKNKMEKRPVTPSDEEGEHDNADDDE